MLLMLLNWLLHQAFCWVITVWQSCHPYTHNMEDTALATHVGHCEAQRENLVFFFYFQC